MTTLASRRPATLQPAADDVAQADIARRLGHLTTLLAHSTEDDVASRIEQALRNYTIDEAALATASSLVAAGVSPRVEVQYGHVAISAP